MTAQQRLVVTAGVRTRSIGLALAAAFAVGLLSGLAGQRFVSMPVAGGVNRTVSRIAFTGVADHNMSDAVWADRLVHEHGGPLESGGIVVNAYTGFSIGALAGHPEVNPYTGFTTGWQLGPSR